MKLPAAALMISAASAQFLPSPKCALSVVSNAIQSIDLLSATPNLEQVCPRVDDIFTDCTGLDSFAQCCPSFGVMLKDLFDTAVTCGEYFATRGASSGEVCTDLQNVCNSPCGQAMNSVAHKEFTYCAFDFLTGALQTYLDDVVSLPGMIPIPDLPSIPELFPDLTFDLLNVCTYADRLDQATCDAMLSDPGAFDWQSFLEPFYPNFQLPQSVDLSMTLTGVDISADTAAIAQGVIEDLVSDLGLPQQFFSTPQITVGDNGEVHVTVTFTPPEDFDQFLKDLFPPQFDLSLFDMDKFDLSSIPDGNTWNGPGVPSGKTWADLVDTLVDTDLSQLAFSRVPAGAAGAAAALSSSSATPRATTYADLGRKTPTYGSAMAAATGTVSAASNVQAGVAAVASASALAYLA